MIKIDVNLSFVKLKILKHKGEKIDVNLSFAKLKMLKYKGEKQT